MIYNAEKDALLAEYLISLRDAGETAVILKASPSGIWLGLDGDSLCVIDAAEVNYSPADGYSWRE